MVQRIERRRRVTMCVVALICGLVLLSPAFVASADRSSGSGGNFKDNFKAGCEAGGGSFVEDASTNTFRCNLSDGGAIVCPEGGGQCWYEPAKPFQGVLGTSQGKLPVNAGTQGGSAPTPTPTRPGGSVLGGISKAPITGVKAPPQTGNTSGIDISGWTCPQNYYGNEFNDFTVLTANCQKVQTFVFELVGPIPEEFPKGDIAKSGLPAGSYEIRELPTNYDVVWAYCAVGPTGSPAANWTAAQVIEGYYYVDLAANQTITCDWFNILEPGASPPPTPTKPAGGGQQGGISGIGHPPVLPKVATPTS